MFSHFVTSLEVKTGSQDNLWILTKELIYFSKYLNTVVHVPEGFVTDLASVPRIPIVYDLWGNRSHHEAVIHDFLYREGCPIPISCSDANYVFLEAMESRGKPWHIRYPMYWGVCAFGSSCFKRRAVDWNGM